jgi:hypothetical protein
LLHGCHAAAAVAACWHLVAAVVEPILSAGVGHISQKPPPHLPGATPPVLLLVSGGNHDPALLVRRRKNRFEYEAGEEMESCIYGRSLPSLSLSLTTHTRTKITNFRHKIINVELLGCEFCSLFSLNPVARSGRLLRKGRVGAHKRVADSPFCSGLFYW